MSHFTEIKSSLKDFELIRRSLRDLGMEFTCDAAGVQVRGFMGDKTSCEFCISTGTNYDVGLRKVEDGSYEFIADWETLEKMKIKTEEIRNKIQQKYSYLNLKDQLQEQGFEINEEEIDESGNIQLRVSQW